MDLELAKVLAGMGGLVAGVGVFTSWAAVLIGAVLIYVGLSAYVERLGDVVAKDNAVKRLLYVVFASVAFAVAQSATGFSLMSPRGLGLGWCGAGRGCGRLGGGVDPAGGLRLQDAAVAYANEGDSRRGALRRRQHVVLMGLCAYHRAHRRGPPLRGIHPDRRRLPHRKASEVEHGGCPLSGRRSCESPAATSSHLVKREPVFFQLLYQLDELLNSSLEDGLPLLS
jgi:hypothetical protein